MAQNTLQDIENYTVTTLQHIEDYAVMAGYWGEGIGRGTLLILPFAVLAALSLALIYLVMGSILIRAVS